MCGIGGILRTDGESIAHTRLDAIEAAVAHRGPDGAGRFRDRVEIDDPGAGRRIVEVALVHRRLSIIDHEGGGQPMVSERGRGEGEGLVAVVFNGCIYNHRDLRRELESRGHRFRTDHSDTEVLLHGHREWGDELREHLEGMYAYAIWDRAAATLTLARDRFGEKPLYVRRGARAGDGGGDVVEFASARGGLGGLGGLGDEGVSEDALVRYLRAGCGWGAVIEPGFAGVAGVARLAPGDVVSFGPDGDRRRPRPPLPDPVQTTLTPDGIEPLLETAVATRLEADVPLGCFLSGGVDSSLIALYAQRHRPDLRTFSVRMPDARYDESAHAERVARHLGTDHTTLDVAMSPAEDLVRLVDRLGQPFADSSILPTYWVSRAARAHVKVALSGDSGDELFIGYERYAAAAALARHRGWLRRLPRALHRGAHPKSLRSKLARLGDMARDHARLGIAAMESIFTETQIAALLDAPPPAPAAPDDTGLHPVDALRRHDVLHYLPDDLLTKVDTASMAVALEVRCPFLDRDLAGAALATPARVLAPGGRRKGLLRDLARRHLPADVVDRPKMGFAIPIGEWFRSDHGGLRTLLGDHLSARNPLRAFDLDRAAVARLLDEHLAGRRDHTHRLFALLTLSMWAGS